MNPFVIAPFYPQYASIATLDMVDDLPRYFVMSNRVPEYTDWGDIIYVSNGFFIYNSCTRHSDFLVQYITATSGIDYSDGMSISSVPVVNISGMSIYDSASANGNLYLLIEEGINNTWVLNYTNHQAFRLGNPDRAASSPFCRSIAENGTMFGSTVSAGYDSVNETNHNYTVMRFFDLSGNNFMVEPVYGNPSIYMSKSGYGYYSTGDINASPLGGSYYNPQNTLKQASLSGGTTKLKTIVDNNAYNWNVLTNSNTTTNTAYAIKQWWTGSELSATILAIDEKTFTATAIYSYNPNDMLPQNVSKDGTKILALTMTGASIIDTATLSSIDAIDFINTYYPFIKVLQIQNILGNALVFMATFNDNFMTMAIDINSHIIYIGDYPRDIFLRRRLLGYC